MGDDPHHYLEVSSYLLLHPEDNHYGYLSLMTADAMQPKPGASSEDAAFSSCLTLDVHRILRVGGVGNKLFFQPLSDIKDSDGPT